MTNQIHLSPTLKQLQEYALDRAQLRAEKHASLGPVIPSPGPVVRVWEIRCS